MATLNIVPTAPAQVTNVLCAYHLAVSSLSWDLMPDATTYEVWSSDTVCDLSTASQLATVSTNRYNESVLASFRYYWVRSVNQYGVKGPFSATYPTAQLGSNFNALYLVLEWYGPTGTVSVQNVQANVYYTTAAGVATSTGLQSFTSTITQTTNTSTTSPYAWTNPDNARVDDTSYATVTVSGTNQFANLLHFNLGDLGVPSTATVTAVVMQLKAKATTTAGTFVAWIGDGTSGDGWDRSYSTAGLVAQRNFFAALSAANTDNTLTVGSSSADSWGLQRTGADYAVTYITSLDVTAPPSIGSAGVSAGSSSVLATVSAYNTWYEAGHASFTAPGVGSDCLVTVSSYAYYTISSVVTGGTLQVFARTRLYDVTTGADVPGGTKTSLVYQNTGLNAFGALLDIFNSNDVYASGFRGSLLPNHSYRIYVEFQKVQTSSASLTLTLNGAGVSATSSGSL